MREGKEKKDGGVDAIVETFDAEVTGVTPRVPEPEDPDIWRLEYFSEEEIAGTFREEAERIRKQNAKRPPEGPQT